MSLFTLLKITRTRHLLGNKQVPLGPKSLLIREAIAANPDVGNTELAEMVNGSDARKEDKIKVSAQDMATQRQAMKKAGAAPAARRKPGRKPGRKPAAKAPPPAAQPSAAKRGLVELIDRVFELAEEMGGWERSSVSSIGSPR